MSALLDRLHGRLAYPRRVDVLSRHFAEVLPAGRVLDVGCGDGKVGRAIQDRRPDVVVEGVDVLVRDATSIPVTGFDGRSLPCADDAYDAVMFSDVLHHADHPLDLLREAARVARHAVVVKDHTLRGFLAGPTLRFMDRVGNRRYGVALPYGYWTEPRWHEVIDAVGLRADTWKVDLGLYRWPLDHVFERRLHFVARLVRREVK